MISGLDFCDFRLDFWFQIEFLLTVYKISLMTNPLFMAALVKIHKHSQTSLNSDVSGRVCLRCIATQQSGISLKVSLSFLMQ